MPPSTLPTLKHLTLSVLLLLSGMTYGQVRTLKARVLSDAGVPIRGALISCNGCQASTSNSRGDFQIAVAPNVDSLIIAAVPFKTKRLPLKSLTGETIRLTPLPIVTSKSESATPLINGVIAAAAQNYNSSDIQLKSFHREKVTSFNHVIQLLEVTLDTKRKDGQTDVRMENGFYLEDRKQRELFWNPGTGGFYTFGWRRLTGLNTPSEPCFLGVYLKEGRQIKDYYTFRETGRIREGKTTLHVLEFDQLNVKASLLKGTLYVDSASKAVVKMTYKLSPQGTAHLIPNRATNGLRICNAPKRVEILEEEGAVVYRQTSGKWHYSHGWTETDFHASFDTLQSPKKHFLKLSSEEVVTYAELEVSGSKTEGQPWVCHDDIKKKFNGVIRENESPLLADFNIVSTIKSINHNNALWERNERRSAFTQLKERTTHNPEKLIDDLSKLEALFIASPAIQQRVDERQLKELFTNAKQKITRPLSERDFIRILQPIIASLKYENAVIHESPAADEYTKRFGRYFPLKVVVSGDTLFLPSNDKQELTTIASINGKKASEIIATLLETLNSEGKSSNQTDYFLSRSFSEMYAFYIDQPDTFRLELLNTKTKSINQDKLLASRYKGGPSQEPTHVFIDSLQTILLKIPTFPKEELLEQTLEDVISPLKTLAANLILDLRGNTSTSDSGAITLYRRIAIREFNYYDSIVDVNASLKHKPTITDLRQTKTALAFMSRDFEPHPNGFRRNVYVLLDHGSGYAATRVAALVQHHKRGIIIGPEIPTTSSVPPETIILSNSGVRLNVSLSLFKHASVKDNLLTPDYVIANNNKSNLDNQLEYILNTINQNWSTARSD